MQRNMMAACILEMSYILKSYHLGWMVLTALFSNRNI